MEKNYFLIKNLIKYFIITIIRIVKPVVRNQNYVRTAQNFHRKIEFRIFKNLNFKKYTLYDHFEINKILYKNKIVIGKNYLIREEVYNILSKYIKYRNKNEAIFELGSGNGRNLAYFAKKYKKIKFYGFDISDVNYSTSNYFKKKFKIQNLKFYKKDITQNKNFNHLKINPKVIFTCFAIEQIPFRFKEVLENIGNLKPDIIVFIEPFPEYQDLSLRGISTKLRAYSFNRIFYHRSLIKNFVKKYNYKIIVEGKCGFGGNPFNEACKVILKKI